MPVQKNKKKLILVTGATGQQGGSVLRRLRERGFPVRALTRDPDQPKARALAGQGVELVRGDLNDPASLTRAMDGADGVFSVQNWREVGVDGETRHGINLVDAARAARISQFVYSSVAGADQRSGIPFYESKFRIEEHLRASGVHYTILRPCFLMENWLAMRQMIESGVISQPLNPGTVLQMTAVDDIGGVTAAAFEHSGRWQDRTFELACDELSMEALAQVFTRAAGREVKYVQMPWDEFDKRAGKETARMCRWLETGEHRVDLSTVRQEYPKLMTFEHWINSYWHSAVRKAG